MIELDLRDPWVAAFLAWLIPGAGHFYQRRIAKGVLFFLCVLGTYFFGMYLGGGRVVYASLRPDDRRLAYLCQVGVGLPALPAVVQAYRMRDPNQPKSPLWNGFMAPPRLPRQVIPNDGSVPPDGVELIPGTDAYVVNLQDELHQWQFDLAGYFELGTVYTMIAGLLNVLVIYDAWGGPLLALPGKKESDEEDSASDATNPD